MALKMKMRYKVEGVGEKRVALLGLRICCCDNIINVLLIKPLMQMSMIINFSRVLNSQMEYYENDPRQESVKGTVISSLDKLLEREAELKILDDTVEELNYTLRMHKKAVVKAKNYICKRKYHPTIYQVKKQYSAFSKNSFK